MTTMTNRMAGELKAEELESRRAPLSIATTDPILEAPIDVNASDGTPEMPAPPCQSPKGRGGRSPLVYQDLA